MGISTLMRINYSLWQCNQASLSDDVNGWFKAIKIVYKECHVFMKEKDREESKFWFKQIEEKYRNYLVYVRNYETNSKTNRNVMFFPPRAVFDLLFEWELKLRIVLDGAGLLMKKGDRADQAIM